MGLLSGTKVKGLAAAIVLTLLALVGVSSWGLLQALTAIGTAGSTPVFFAMLSAAAPWIVAGILLSLLTVVFVFSLLAVLAGRAANQVSMPTLQSERLSMLVGYVEDEVPGAKQYGIAEWLAPPEPTFDEKREALRERYVDGELSDSEFERKLQRLYEDEEGLERAQFRDDLDTLLDDAEAHGTGGERESRLERERH
ncbi:hypothetical protein [Haloarchaeobius sp. DFWS5]|uniref:hypothetical protein n=1 Tax=Haloarchaeobius sp. DFWS5 TaxID=3446114 RepID=UPI003EBC6215